MNGNFIRQLTNLNYVKIDESIALEHWVFCVEGMDTYFWEVNYKNMMRMKSIAGIIAHRGHGGGKWSRYSLKERLVMGRINS